MKKMFVRLVCCFIPSQKMRHRIRRKYIKNTIKNTGYVQDNGKNNKIVVVAPDGTRRVVASFCGLNIKFNGDNNYIELHEPLDKMSLIADLHSNAEIIIHYSVCDIRLNVSVGLNSPRKSRLIIGPNFWSTGVVNFEFKDSASVIIGKDCMFSWGITLRTTDHHTILEKNTNNIINDNRDIIIGNHVWIGSDAMILKGSVISDNSVIGTRSVVAGKFDESNVIIAGVPAHILKHDIDWDHRTTYEYQCDMNK